MHAWPGNHLKATSYGFCAAGETVHVHMYTHKLVAAAGWLYCGL